jgi:hypothetical protein
MLKGFLDFLKGKQAQRFYWNTANGAVGLSIAYLSGIDFVNVSPSSIVIVGLIVAALNGVTKEISNKLK